MRSVRHKVMHAHVDKTHFLPLPAFSHSELSPKVYSVVGFVLSS